LVKRTNHLVVSSFRGNDFDRVASFDKVCRKTGRTLVVSMKVAILLEKLKSDRHLKVPRIGKDFLVYLRRKGKGRYDDRDYYRWEKPFLDHSIAAADVKKKQKEMFLHLDVWHFPELIDIQPERGGAYIHATTETFNEEGEREDEAIKNWTDHFGFSYHQLHASGHASQPQVEELVRRIDATQVIPVHTERADLFESFRHVKKVVRPVWGKRIKL